jgi:hypothetical protein
MKIFVSYSFRRENAWVTDFVIPLLEHFGHTPITGKMLDAGPLDDEVKKKIRQCRRTICFVTRGRERYERGSSTPSSYEPPDWVRDELIIGRSTDGLVTEFRESHVDYGGAAAFHSFTAFDRGNLPKLLLDIAATVADWPIGPIQLRLSFPDALRAQIVAAANAGMLRAKCSVLEDGEEIRSEEVPIHLRDDQLIALFWVKPRDNYLIDVIVPFGAQSLARRGISPIVREAALSAV